jgi:nickel-type superoxide dismutase maturation protease
MNSDKHIPTPLPEPSWYEWILWLLRRRKRLQVTGESMLPTLMPNDIVLIDTNAYNTATPHIGEVVLVKHPYKDLLIIKRVADITPEGRLELRSDNPQVGSDSRQFGTIGMQQIIGHVTCRSTLAEVK